MKTSKSPRKVMAEALAAAEASLPLYAHRFAPKKFTQPQLFACLVLKEFEKKDYRGVCALLADCSDLRAVIGLKIVPHYTTLQKASVRLLHSKQVRRLLAQTVRRIHRRRQRVPYGAGDSSGFDAHHASRYFIIRSAKDKKDDKKAPKQRVSYKRYGKLMVIVCCLSHAILAAVRLRRLVLDAGFDSAHNHRLLREDNGIRSTIPPEYGRKPKDPDALPPDKYRRLMKTRFNQKAYRKRPQVESVFSMLKRNLGSALRARSHHGRRRDLLLRALTHNLMLALMQVFYRAGQDLFLSHSYTPWLNGED